jgi:hypothetical protein
MQRRTLLRGCLTCRPCHDQIVAVSWRVKLIFIIVTV